MFGITYLLIEKPSTGDLIIESHSLFRIYWSYIRPFCNLSLYLILFCLYIHHIAKFIFQIYSATFDFLFKDQGNVCIVVFGKKSVFYETDN